MDFFIIVSGALDLDYWVGFQLVNKTWRWNSGAFVDGGHGVFRNLSNGLATLTPCASISSGLNTPTAFAMKDNNCEMANAFICAFK